MGGAQRAESRRLWLAALDQRAAFRPESTLALLRAAIRADTSYFLPFDLYITEMSALGRYDQLEREFPEPERSAGVLARCVSAGARFARPYDIAALTRALRNLDGRPDPTGCRASIGARTRTDATPARSLADAREALGREPESVAGVWQVIAQQLNALGQHANALAVIREGIRRSPHFVHTLKLQAQLARQYDQMGDSLAARRLLVAMQASVTQDGRPWLRWEYLDYAGQRALAAGDVPRLAALTREQSRIARREGAVVAEFWNEYRTGSALFDLGRDLGAAVAALAPAAELADRIGAPSLRTIAHLKLGRALTARGDYRRAESAMQTALAAAPRRALYDLGEAHHGLAHLYEAEGRWPDATREVDLFAKLALQRGAPHPEYMMSLHDAGMIKWKAGWHAAAAESFRGMVREIESHKENYFYAGEFFERTGDFARALGYYRLGAAQKTFDDRPLNLAGLVRMFGALGMRDSARTAATLHDTPAWRHGHPRLLPSILVAEGNVDDGVRLAREEVSERGAAADVRGAIRARLQLARILLDAGRAADAAGEASRAEQQAERATLTDERIDAILLSGGAMTLLRSPEAIATLLRARSLIRRHPTAPAALAVETALGEAYAAFGRPEDALQAFNRAAATSQQVTGSYEEALDRARHREQLIAVFEGALRVLLAMPDSPNRSQRLFEWSARKKSVVLGAADSSSATRPLKLSVKELGRRSGEGVAILDFLAVDDEIVALVVARGTVKVVRLPLSVSAATDLARRLRKPFTVVGAGRLDLARTPFDLDVAHRLYTGLFPPLESLLAGIGQIVIVPDGPLYGVPFSALPRTPPRRGGVGVDYHGADYLIDRVEIIQAPSVAAADGAGESRVAAGARVLVVRGSVPGGEREAASVASAWPAGRATVLGGATATESALRSGVGGTHVIHFAVHARADENDPLAAYLELTRDGTDDGFLHLPEIAALRFADGLVVLTGCETLPGRAFAGTGPFGIASGFLAAGARNVIATHWPVGETAAELSRELHRGLAGGADAGAALRAAQLRLRREPATAHPFYWGGYAVIGAAR